jgi:amino acid adenylation domain-containing protein
MVFEEGSVISLFEKQVVENPDAFAIIHGEETLTYATLNDKVNALANALLSSGQLEGNAPVGILASHSEWAIISMLAVQKAGGYYIPIDEKYPKERIEFIIQDSGCKLLLQHGGVDYGFEGLTVIDPTGSSIYAQELATVSTEIVADTIAYCIYTSGSTGQPKGCLVTHGNLYNYVSWANDYYFGGTDSGNFGFITSISFDLTVTSIFTTLTRGKKISIHTQEHISELLRATFEDNNVDTLKLTPAHLILAKELNIQNTSVRTLICGGEQLTQHHIDCVRAIHPEIQVFNEYGPTEATVGCVVAKIDTEDTAPITIGKPIANTKITILDASGNLAPIGVMGELMISGSGVAKGYVNREALTAERFVTIAATRSYKTGDLGRWLPDGTIEYYKRADDQVKVKGYRIELKEIEAVLRENETIQEAVVLIDGDVDKEIIAFVQATHEQNEMELIALLSEKLPEYMIPTAFVQIATVP